MPVKLLVASGMIACLCWAVFALSGHPWGVTFGFTLWAQNLLLPLALICRAMISGNGPGQRGRWRIRRWLDTSSLMDIGMFIGAGLWASFVGSLRSQTWPNRRQLLAAAIGGLLMGIGARLAFGCNIGAFLAGTASGSLHGWIWFAMALAGSCRGSRCDPILVSSGGCHDASCLSKTFLPDNPPAVLHVDRC